MLICHPATQRQPTAGWIVSRVCLHAEGDGFWVVFGEATNNTGSYLGFPIEVVATFFDGNGTQLAQDFSDIDAETMPNGAKLPFAISIDSLNPPAQVGFSITGDFADLMPREDLVLSGLQLMPVGNELFLTGQVQNPGPALTDFAEVIATFYDQNGAVVALGYQFLDPLDASETMAFEVPVDGLLEFVTDFRVVVYGY